MVSVAEYQAIFTSDNLMSQALHNIILSWDYFLHKLPFSFGCCELMKSLKLEGTAFTALKDWPDIP